MSGLYTIKREVGEFLFCQGHTWVFSLFFIERSAPTVSVHIRNSLENAEIGRIVDYLIELFPGARYQRGSLSHVYFFDLTPAHKAWLSMVCD